MKYRVRIDDRWYEVEIADLNARPVRTIVDGEVFEVWPEDENSGGKSNLPPMPEQPKKRAGPSPVGFKQALSPGSGNGASAPSGEGSLKVLRAPIPGVIVSIAVQPEDEVAIGQELCVLEAMKMKNSIRSTRAGVIAAIGVSVGQHVKHHDVLIEFTS
jgi:glutaconyl-CoA/methylmalonyl-CoA decarboxylase subunit gamma